jgi:hypothetical protein
VRLVESLTTAAPVVVFSAAVPGQGGTHHINLQWPWYWRELFKRQGFVCFDAIRPLLWCDDRVDWVYRQNIYAFLSEQACDAHPNLTRYQIENGRQEKLTVIDERILKNHSTPDAQSMSVLIAAIIRKVMRHIRTIEKSALAGQR